MRNDPETSAVRLPLTAPLSLDSFVSLRRALNDQERDYLRGLAEVRAARDKITEQARQLGLVPPGRKPLEGLSCVLPDEGG